MPRRPAGRPADPVGQYRLVRHRQPAQLAEPRNPGGRPRARRIHHRLRRQPPRRRLAAPALRHPARTAPVAGSVPLPADPAGAAGQQAHRPAGRRRAAAGAGSGNLPGPRHCPLRAAGQARGCRCRGPRPGHHLAAGPGNPGPRGDSRALCGADGRAAQEQEPQCTNGRAATGRPGGDRNHDAGPGRSGRPGLGPGALHRQHHPPGPAVDQDRTGFEPGVVGVLHAVPRAGAGVRRLRDEPAPERCRTGRDRPAECRIGAGLRHRATGGDDQLFKRFGQRRGSRESARSDPPGTGRGAGAADRRAVAV
ncbi:hypothetical protein D3C76_918030 [compost metagenome]